jgi:RHS repeat-associated protein
MRTARERLWSIALVIVFAWLPALTAIADDTPTRTYIVILRQRSDDSPDVAHLGGRIIFRQAEQLVITLPEAAVGELKADSKVLYVQPLAGGSGFAEGPLIGTPAEPRPETAVEKISGPALTPKPLGTLLWDSQIYTYDGAGDITAIGVQHYSYDGMQRLVEAMTNGVSESFGYDRFGNRNSKKTNNVPETVPAPDPATNHLSSEAYDDDGSMKGDGYDSWSYDPLSQPISKVSPGGTEYYVYTASDERLAVQQNGWWYWNLRDEGGKILRQYRSSASTPSAPLLWMEDFVWRDGLLLGSQRPVELGGRRHFHLDHLGTPRLVTSDSGQQVSAHDYFPSGAEQTPIVQETTGGFDREEPLKFTGHERDFAGGFGREDGHYVDYMHARYYSPVEGRFLSVDAVRGSPRWPQTWNRYTYVLNNPINATDPTGLCGEPDDFIGPRQPCDMNFKEEIAVTAKNPTDQEHYLFLQKETVELGPFMPDWYGAHLYPDQLWASYQLRQEEKRVGHPVTPGMGVVMIGVMLVGGEPEIGSGPEPELLARDITGKIHGELPTVEQLKAYPSEDLKVFQAELEGSVQRRIDVTNQLGPDKAHGQRQAAEQQLIKQIQKILADRGD